MRVLLPAFMMTIFALGLAQDPDIDIRPSVAGYTQNFEIQDSSTASPIRIEKDGPGLMVLKIIFNCRPSSLILSGSEGQQVDLFATALPNGSMDAVVPAEGDPGYPASIYTFTFMSFPSGSWVLIPGFNSFPAGGVHGTYQMMNPSQVSVLVAVPRAMYPVGEVVLPVLYVGWNGLAIPAVQVDAKIVLLDSPGSIPKSINFLDDGAGADKVAGDGNYTAELASLEPGHYTIWVSVRGQTSDGPFLRTASSKFWVYRPKVIIGLTIEDRPIVGLPR